MGIVILRRYVTARVTTTYSSLLRMSASGSSNEAVPEVVPEVTSASTTEVFSPTPKRAFKDVRPSAGKKPVRAAKAGASKTLGKKPKKSAEKFEPVTQLPSGFFTHPCPCSHCGAFINVDPSIPLTFSRGANKSPGHRFVTKVGGDGRILVVALCVRCNNGLLQKINQETKPFLLNLKEIASLPDLERRIEHPVQWKEFNEQKRDDLIASLVALRKKRQELLNSEGNHVDEIALVDRELYARMTQIEELRNLINTIPTTPEGIALEKERIAARRDELVKLTAEFRWKIRKYNNVRTDGMMFTDQDFSASRPLVVPTPENPSVASSIEEAPAPPAPKPKATPAPAEPAPVAAVPTASAAPAEKTKSRRAAPMSNWDL